MSVPKYLSSEVSEHLPRSAFETVNVPEIYNKLGLDYEKYILEDEGRAKTIQWVISKLMSSSTGQGRGLYVVDLGCASGRPTVETIAKSLLESQQHSGPSNQHVVLGVDVSDVQLTHARQRITAVNPIAQFEISDMRSWSPPASWGGVDAILSHYALNHLPLEDYRAMVHKMVSWLKPGGLLALGTLAHVNGKVRWLGFDVSATSILLSEIVELVEKSGCRVEQSWEEEWKSSTRPSAKGKLNQFILAVKR